MAVLREVVNRLRSRTFTNFELDLNGHLTFTVSAAADVPTVDRITLGILDQVIRHIDEAFRPVTDTLRETAKNFIQKDLRGKQVLGPYRQYSWSYGSDPWNTREKESLFAIKPLRIKTSTVVFDVSPQLAAVTRNVKRLKLLTEGAVIDYYERSYKEHPQRDQYAITKIGRSSLQIAAREENTAEQVSRALLGESIGLRPSRRSIDRWPPATTAYWGFSTVALAIFTVAIAAVRVTPLWLGAVALSLALTVTIALLLARLGGASVPKTALGMSPSVIVIGFAVYYGSLMIGTHPSVDVVATAEPHLVDAFLLSLGMASTGGFFDFALKSVEVRVAALIEMLLMVTVAGGSLYAGARAAWRRIGDLLRGGAQG